MLFEYHCESEHNHKEGRVIHDFTLIRVLQPQTEPSIETHYREEMARSSRVVKAKKLPQQPIVNVALLRASWILAAGRFARPA